MELARKAGWVWWEAGQLGNLVDLLLEAGELEEGERRGREYLALARRIDDRLNMIFALGLLAWAAAERGDSQRAATLWAAAEAEDAKAPSPEWARERDTYAAHIPDDPRAAAALPLDEAVELGLGGEALE